MKILIVDDELTKITTLKNELFELNVQDSDVSVAYHAAEARKLLQEIAFDIMLLDVLLPVREGKNPSGETSVELLRQIVDDGDYIAPKYIIGITANLDALQQHDSEFRNLTSHIIEITPVSDDWKTPLRASISHLQNTKNAELTYNYDVCVLTALRDPELKAVLSTWSPKFTPEEILISGVMVRSGTINCNNAEKRVVFAYLPKMGLIAATHMTEALLQTFKPRVLIMTGICGGFSDRVNIGDVVVANKSWDWQEGKWTENGVLMPSPDQKDASSELVAIARGIESRLNDFQSNFQGNIPNTRAKLITEPMVSGSSVVASIDIQTAFRDQHRKMAAVDMECYGMYYAATMTSAPKPETICIKSVSDLADREKADDLQKYCSYMSACVALELMQNYWKS
jgi:nucleoside phosphorylase